MRSWLLILAGLVLLAASCRRCPEPTVPTRPPIEVISIKRGCLEQVGEPPVLDPAGAGRVTHAGGCPSGLHCQETLAAARLERYLRATHRWIRDAVSACSLPDDDEGETDAPLD